MGSSVAGAKEVALLVYTYEPSEHSEGPFAAYARRFEKAFALNPNVTAISLDVHSPAEFLEKVTDLTVSPGSITRLRFEGHGCPGRVGSLTLDDLETQLGLRALAPLMSPRAEVVIDACRFVPPSEAEARPLLAKVARLTGARAERVSGYFESSTMHGGRATLRNPFRATGFARRRLIVMQSILAGTVVLAPLALYFDSGFLDQAFLTLGAFQAYPFTGLKQYVARRRRSMYTFARASSASLTARSPEAVDRDFYASCGEALSQSETADSRVRPGG